MQLELARPGVGHGVDPFVEPKPTLKSLARSGLLRALDRAERARAEPADARQATGMSIESEAQQTCDLDGALAGHAEALAQLIDRLTPIIQVRVARQLLKRRPSLSGQRLRQEVEDLVQDVMVSLFADNAEVMRSWDASRGLSLDNFVGMVAERQVFTILQSRKKTWPAEFRNDDDLDRASPERSPEQQASARQTFDRMLEMLRSELSPKGFEIFSLLFVEELTVPEVQERTGLGEDAIYAWRSRLRRKTRVLMERIELAPVQPRAAESGRRNRS